MVDDIREGDTIKMGFVNDAGKFISYLAEAKNRSLCRHCDEQVIWVKTRNDKEFPADIRPVEGFHNSHVTSCTKRPNRPVEAGVPY